MRSDGWKIYVDSSSGTNIRGYVSGRVNLNTSQNFRARYALTGGHKWIDLAFPSMENLYRYDYSVEDLTTGEEVLVLSGAHTARKAANDLINNLR